MKFAKKTSDNYYKIAFPTVEEAVKELKKDRRVKSVVKKRNSIFIETKPILPKTSDKDNDILLAPIGVYTIEIYSRTYDITYEVTRKHGGVAHRWSYYHPHVDNSGCCFGNVDDEIDTIRDKKDYYWLAVRILDLLEDGDVEEDEEVRYYSIMIKLQRSYLRKYKPRGYARLLKVLSEKFEKYDEIYDIRSEGW